MLNESICYNIILPMSLIDNLNNIGELQLRQTFQAVAVEYRKTSIDPYEMEDEIEQSLPQLHSLWSSSRDARLYAQGVNPNVDETNCSSDFIAEFAKMSPDEVRGFLHGVMSTIIALKRCSEIPEN